MAAADDEVPDWILGAPRAWRSWNVPEGRPGELHTRRDLPEGNKQVTWEPGARPADLLYFATADNAPPEPGGELALCEGEKAADAAAEAGFDAAGTVCGAGAQPSDAVVELLARYRLVMSPDADDVGERHMRRLAQRLERAGASTPRWLRPPEGSPSGWDLADADIATRHQLLTEAPALLGWEPGGPREAPELLSAEQAAESGRNLVASFRTAAEITAALPDAVEWCWRCYVARGAITELVGQAKAAGKTTLLLHAARAILDGDEFLGQPTERTPVVLLTEQPPVSLRAVLERTGLDQRADLRILLWRDARASSWRDVVAAAVEVCRELGAALLLVDTLPAFAGIRGEAENDAGAALAALEPLQVAAADGLAVVVVRHERKGGGDVGESARGSSAFTGAVDIVLRLARQQNPVRPTVRVLSALSRFDETPAEILVELGDDGYASLGEEAAVAFAEAREGLLGILPDAPDRGLTLPEIVEAGGGRRSTVQEAIKVLERTFRIERVGSGRRGDPHRFRRIAAGDPFLPVSAESRPAETNGFLSAGATPVGGVAHPGRNASQPVARTVGEEMAAIFAPPPEPDLPFFSGIDTLSPGRLS